MHENIFNNLRYAINKANLIPQKKNMIQQKTTRSSINLLIIVSYVNYVRKMWLQHKCQLLVENGLA